MEEKHAALTAAKPKPKPKAKPEPESYVSVYFAVKNVDHPRVSAIKSMLNAVTAALKESIAAEAGEGISPGQVELELAAGSLLDKPLKP